MDLEKFKGADPSTIQKQASSEKPEVMVKTAQVETAAGQNLREVWKDPFNIDVRADTSHMDAANWEQVKKQEVLDAPSVMMGSVIAIGGGEDYFANSDVNPAANQNSITNPDAIQQLAESETLDTGERLRQEKAAKEEQKKADHSEWQQDKIDDMAHNDIVPKGTVFPTESLNAHTGMGHAPVHGGVYSDSKKQAMPDKTEGEMIAEKNETRKASIQRPQEKEDWQKPSTQSARSISNDFADALAAQLNK
jgi:hypothetical protein